MLVINSIEKTRLSADSYSYSGTGVAWKARLVLFLGFALMAGGLAGSVVSQPLPIFVIYIPTVFKVQISRARVLSRHATRLFSPSNIFNRVTLFQHFILESQT